MATTLATKKRSCTEKENGIGNVIIDTPTKLAELQAEASRQSTEELKQELSQLLGITADKLVRLAVIVTELESRGEDLRDLRMGILPILRKIGLGQLLPDLVVMLSGKPALLNKAAKLPLDRQKRIVDGDEDEEELVDERPKIIRSGVRGNSDAFINRPSLGVIAKSAAPRDVADMAVELVKQAATPKVVAAILVDMLKESGLLA